MNRAKKVASLSNATSTVYSVGAGNRWYISVNHSSRNCQMTAGEEWWPVSRQEAAKWIFDTTTAP